MVHRSLHQDISTGLDRILNDDAPMPGGALALCTNHTGVTRELTRGVDALINHGADIRALLTPEHGYWGTAQAGASEGSAHDAITGLPILDTYLLQGSALGDLLLSTGAERILIDLQDIGTRFYTYIWTVYDLLCTAARVDIGVTILDRPNPLGSSITGPGLDPAASSFIGRVSVPLQHGMTLGELARWFNSVHIPEAVGRTANLEVVPMQGWHKRSALPRRQWVMPSPNIPSYDTAVLYPGTGLLEGTTLSEGRGTTCPFGLIGAGWTDAHFAAALREREVPGVKIREAAFRPIASKWAGEIVHGVQIHLEAPELFDAVTTGWTVLHTVRQLYPDHQLWREEPEQRRPFIDLLWGSPALRQGINQDWELRSILDESPAAPDVPQGVLLY